MHPSTGMAADLMATALPQRDEDTTLAVRARTEREAFGALFDRWLPRIYGYVYKRVGHRETAEDLTSKAFEKAWNAIGSFDPARGTWSSWMYRIATNVLFDHYRAAKDVALLEEDAAEALPDKTDLVRLAEQGLDRARLVAAMAKLPERYRLALHLRFFEERTTEEMMEIMSIKRGTLAVLVHRSLRALAKHLPEEGST